MFDKTHNLRCILRDYESRGKSLWARFNVGKKQIRWYYRKLLRIYKKRVSGEDVAPLLREYQRLVKRLRKV